MVLDVGLYLASKANVYVGIGVVVLDFVCTFSPSECKAVEDAIVLSTQNGIQNGLNYALSDPLPVTTPATAPGVPTTFRFPY